MKKLIAMAVAILITACIAVFASGKKPGAFPPKQYNYMMSITKIVVAGNIDVELKESDNKIIEVTGNEADVENLDWKIKGSILYLDMKKGSFKDKVKATIGVNLLEEVLIKGKSTLSSEGPLLSPNLFVYMLDDCFVSIKSTGHIYIIKGTDTEIEVSKIVGNVKLLP